jgi:hypothetical protein
MTRAVANQSQRSGPIRSASGERPAHMADASSLGPPLLRHWAGSCEVWACSAPVAVWRWPQEQEWTAGHPAGRNGERGRVCDTGEEGLRATGPRVSPGVCDRVAAGAAPLVASVPGRGGAAAGTPSSCPLSPPEPPSLRARSPASPLWHRCEPPEPGSVCVCCWFVNSWYLGYLVWPVWQTASLCESSLPYRCSDTENFSCGALQILCSSFSLSFKRVLSRPAL